MDIIQTQRVSFAGSTIAVEFRGDGAANIVDFLYRQVPASSDQPAQFTYRLQPGDQPNELVLHGEETVLYRGEDDALLAELLLGDSCFRLADKSQGGLLLHAAALTWQGGGLLLPGATGAGKSTLAAWLLSQGFDYLTDELAFIPQGNDTFQGLTRPLNIKIGARPVLAQFFDIERHAAQLLCSAGSLLIPPTLLKPDNSVSQPPLSAIIFPRYDPEAVCELRQLSKAQAALALSECLVNARNLPAHGFPEVTRLVQRVPAFRLEYTDFAKVTPLLSFTLEQYRRY